MAKKKDNPYWWANLEGGDEAIQAATNIARSPHLENAWRISNYTKLEKNPEVLSAVLGSQLPFAHARRLDNAVQAEKAAKVDAIYNEAGIPQAMRDPSIKSPAEAAQAARKQKIALQAQDQGGGFWDAVGTPFRAAWQGTKAAVSAGLTALEAVSTPITAPSRAGMAASEERRTSRDAAALAIPVVSPVLQSLFDFGAGVHDIATGDVEDAQRQDMRDAGYDPDSWVSRYAWYSDMGKDSVIDERTVSELKQEHNPHKVDLARELVAIGALSDPLAVDGASEDAQKFYNAVVSGEDKIGNTIVEKLGEGHGLGLSVGRNYADNVHNMITQSGADSDRDNNVYKGIEIAGDLAAFWHLAPEVLAAKGAVAARNKRWVTDLSPWAAKDFVLNSTVGRKRWSDALDITDEIYVLERSGKAEDTAAAAQKLADFRRKHPDLMPVYSTLAQMRSGKVSGAVLRKDTDAAVKSLRNPSDIKENMLAIRYVDDTAKQKPMWELRKQAGDEVSEEALQKSLEAVADTIGDSLFVNALATGSPLAKKAKMLQPGQIRVSYPMRLGLTRFTDKLTKADQPLLVRLKADASDSKDIVDFTASFGADGAMTGKVLSAEGGKFALDNYKHGGMRSRVSRGLQKFALFHDRAVLRFDSPDSTSTFWNFVSPFIPKQQAAYLASQWAKADPAQRSVMYHQMWSMLFEATGAATNPKAADFWASKLKEMDLPLSHGGSKNVAYSSRDRDLINVGNDKMSAGMYSTQFANGAQLPGYLDMVRNSEKVGVLAHVLGMPNTRFASQLARITKIGWIGTPSNLGRQFIEGKALQAVEDPGGALRTSLARLGLAGDTAADRVAVNRSVRQAKKLIKDGSMRRLTPLFKQGKFDEYAAEANVIMGGKANPFLLEVMREGADLTTVAASRNPLRLLATRYGVDPLRQVRARAYAKADPKVAGFAADWADVVDDRFTDALSKSAFQYLGKERHAYVNGAIEDTLEYLDEAAEAGVRVQKLGLANTHGYMDAAGDTGALNWLNTLGQRLSDPVGERAARVVAGSVRHMLKGEKNTTLHNAKRSLAEAHPDLVEKIARIESPESYLKFVLKHTAAGKEYRVNGRRAQYSQDGRFIPDPAQRDMRLDVWAEDMVKDLADYLGLSKLSDLKDAGKEIPKQYDNLLKSIANGDQVTAAMLRKIPEELRPDEVYGPVLVPKSQLQEGKRFWSGQTFSDGASKWYGLVVAKPLQRMLNDPQVIAAHREVMDALEPVARKLAAQGMSKQSVYNLMQSGAYAHALQRAVRYTDNPHTTSYFAALSNNFLWFERATEDFARRAIRITKYNPAILGRSYALTEAGVHSGVVYKQAGVDEDGQETEQWLFTFPGSGLAMRAWSEGLATLGLTDEIKVPVWQNLTAPVKYLSPSLQNPLGFTVTPMMGVPLRFARRLFPEAGQDIDTIISTLEGGERMFAASSEISTLLPVPVRRIWNALDRDDQSSQFASAIGQAMMYHQAAGLAPGPEASQFAKKQYIESLKSTVAGTIAFRGIFGMFSPASPGAQGTNIAGIGDDDINVFDRANGVNTIRSEYYQLLETYNTKFPENPSLAFSEASIEWLRRGHDSILNPEAFQVGSTGEPSIKTGKSFGSNRDLAQWMIENKEYLRSYGPAGYALLPVAAGEFYDQYGYRMQLRARLRQRKSPEEMLEQLYVQQGWREYNRVKNAVVATEHPNAKTAFNRWQEDHAASNPVWAASRSEYGSPDYVATEIAPAVQRMADATDLPPEIAGVRDEIKVLAGLYNDYQSARENISNRWARINLAVAYSTKGDRLFLGGPIEDLWSRMKVWED